MRDVFVGILFAIAPLLITYTLSKQSLENSLTIAAGVFALVVATCPTGRPSGSMAALTPLQERFGEGRIEFVHYFFAAAFILCLVTICHGFANDEALRERERPDRTAHFSPRFWKRFHYATNLATGFALVVMLAARIFGVFEAHALIVGESLVCLAFGSSWLIKGLELRQPRARQPRAQSAGPWPEDAAAIAGTPAAAR